MTTTAAFLRRGAVVLCDVAPAFTAAELAAPPTDNWPVTNGGAAMPPFRNTLSEQQIKNVAAYVTTKIAK